MDSGCAWVSTRKWKTKTGENEVADATAGLPCLKSGGCALWPGGAPTALAQLKAVPAPDPTLQNPAILLSPLLLAAEKPNILIIIADDCTFSDLPVNGGGNANIPNLDALAKESLVFDRAYLSMAMCSQYRSDLYTGRFPLCNGCVWNHGTCRPGTQSIPHYLKPLGYRVGLAGKTHINPRGVFPFELVPGFDSNCVNSPTKIHDLNGNKNFIAKKIRATLLPHRRPHRTSCPLGHGGRLRLSSGQT